jgi:CBS domain-containing protein
METRLTTTTAVEAVMRSPVVTVEGTANLRKAAAVLRDANVGTLAVMDGAAIAGILSERDVTRALADGADPDEIWVADVMREAPRYATTGDRVATAREVMLAAGIRHLPVVEEGELVGIVSMRDVVAAEARNVIHEEDVAELRDLLDSALGDLSVEIAGTDNASYRESLRDRRHRLERVRSALGN